MECPIRKERFVLDVLNQDVSFAILNLRNFAKFANHLYLIMKISAIQVVLQSGRAILKAILALNGLITIYR